MNNRQPDKRPYEDDNSNYAYGGEKRQRPPLSNEIIEAVQMDSLQKLCSSLEPMLRRIVGEEVEKAISRLGPSTATSKSLVPRNSSIQKHTLRDKRFRLQFRNKLNLPLFTGSKLEGEGGAPIHVIIQDLQTGQVHTEGPESCLKLDVVVLEGDFSMDDETDWSSELFEQNIVRERDGKRPLLSGDLFVCMKDGVGTVGDLAFTDNSSWIRSRKFRLGVRVAPGQVEGIRVREAKTEAFTVKDHRGELYKKHYPPALHDEVWRLDRIGKDGAFHKRLNQAGIFTVEDFLRLVVMDPQKLRNILGSGMSNKMWEGTVEHAKTCVLNGKLHVYYADEKQNIGVIFNNIFQLMGLIADGQYMSVELLSESEKIYVDKLVKVAYENWENVVEYDGEALIGVKPYNLQGLNATTEDPGSGGNPGHSHVHRLESGDSGNLQVQLALRSQSQKPNSTNPNERLVNPNVQATLLLEGTNPQPQGLTTGMQRGSFQPTAEHYSHQIRANFLSNMPALLPQSLSQNYQSTSESVIQRTESSQSMSGQNESGLKEFGLSEEELRARSIEMLENDDMNIEIQEILGLMNPSYDDHPKFEIPQEIPHLETDVTEPRAGRANLGWLKLRAALRWCIFVRKRAARRRELERAQLEEVLEDYEVLDD